MRTCLQALLVLPAAGHSIQDAAAKCPTAGFDLSEAPAFFSYHIHVLFWPDAKPGWSDAGPKGRDGAMRLRDAFATHFGIQDKPECDAFAPTDGKLCLEPIDPVVGYGHSSPFPVMNFNIWVPLDRYHDTVPWMMQNRRNYDVLVHPNSGCMLDEHRDWSHWSGDKWQLLLPAAELAPVPAPAADVPVPPPNFPETAPETPGSCCWNGCDAGWCEEAPGGSDDCTGSWCPVASTVFA